VYFDMARETCLIERSIEDRGVVQMGVTRDGDFGYLGVFARVDTGIEPGTVRPVEIDLGENRYFGEMLAVSGVLRDGYSGGYVISQDPAFFEDVARQFEMTIRVEGMDPIVVDLGGSLRAIETAERCNAEQR
jgi:hypothetical protein